MWQKKTPKCHSGGTVAFKRKDWMTLKDFIFFSLCFVHLCCLMQWSVFLWIFFSFCLIRTCNQIAIWYSQVVQLLVRETQSLTWLGASSGWNRESGLVILLTGYWSFVHIRDMLSRRQTGVACGMKCSLLLIVTPSLYFPSSITYYNSLSDIYLHTGKLTLNSLYTSTVWEECYCKLFSFFDESTTMCLHDKPIMNKLLRIKGLRVAVFYFVWVFFCCRCPWRVNLDRPRAVTVWW